jgi:hypothetical protein
LQKFFKIKKSIFMKRVLLIFVLFLFAESIHAQLRFGVKAGLNCNDFITKGESFDTKGTSLQVGLVSQIKIPIVGLGIQPELLYSVNKGGDNSIGYFTVPINIRWQPLPIPLVKPILLVGPYFGYAVNFKGFSKDNIEKFDWGIGLGLGVEVWKLQLSGRYSWGLKNISLNSIQGIRDASASLKNKVFTLSLAYFF